MAQILREKRELSDQFALLLEGKGNRSEFEARLAGLLRRVREDPGKARGGRPGGVRIMSHDSPGVNLAVAQYPQANSFYCGPGSGQSLLSYLGNSVSAYNSSHSLSQANVARIEYFRTDYYGNTPWYTGSSDPYPHPVPTGINRWRVGAENGWYVPVAYPTDLATYKNDLRFDVGHMGYPLMGNTIEAAGEIHYNGHPPDSDVQHWIVLDGFASYGDTTWYTDPAANSVLGWPSAAYNSHSSAAMLNDFIRHRGYVW
ncbi:MAG: hypothetical protein ACRDM0_07980 [Thermoleophilaceae bacterium]